MPTHYSCHIDFHSQKECSQRLCQDNILILSVYIMKSRNMYNSVHIHLLGSTQETSFVLNSPESWLKWKAQIKIKDHLLVCPVLLLSLSVGSSTEYYSKGTCSAGIQQGCSDCLCTPRTSILHAPAMGLLYIEPHLLQSQEPKLCQEG